MLGRWSRGRARFPAAELLSSPSAFDASLSLRLRTLAIIRALLQIGQAQRTRTPPASVSWVQNLKPIRSPNSAGIAPRINVAASNDENAALRDTISGEAEKRVALADAPLRRDIAWRHDRQ